MSRDITSGSRRASQPIWGIHDPLILIPDLGSPATAHELVRFAQYRPSSTEKTQAIRLIGIVGGCWGVGRGHPLGSDLLAIAQNAAIQKRPKKLLK